MMSATSAKTMTGNTMVSPTLEQQWIQAARKGDLQAFNNLVLAHQDNLYQWAYYLVDDADLADDLTQTVFITAYEKLSSFRNGSFRSWLFQIAKNRSIDMHRSKQRHQTVSLNDEIDDENGSEWLDTLEDRGPAPAEQIEQQEQAAAIQGLLDQLPEAYRSVLVLVDMNELDYVEAARALKVPLGTVKSRLVRARLKLRELALQTALV